MQRWFFLGCGACVVVHGLEVFRDESQTHDDAFLPFFFLEIGLEEVLAQHGGEFLSQGGFEHGGELEDDGLFPGVQGQEQGFAVAFRDVKGLVADPDLEDEAVFLLVELGEVEDVVADLGVHGSGFVNEGALGVDGVHGALGVFPKEHGHDVDDDQQREEADEPFHGRVAAYPEAVAV